MEAALVISAFVLVLVWVWRGRSADRRQKVSVDHLPETFVVFDLETTGLDAARHEIIEIAAIRYKKGTTTHDTFQSLVKPKKRLPRKITDLTGITQEMLDADAPPLAEVLPQFNEFIGDLPLVTFNAEFDMAFLEAAYANHGLPKPKNKVSCALKMARRAWPGRKSYRLDDLAKDGSIAEGRAHRALEDARRALIVYAAASAELQTLS